MNYYLDCWAHEVTLPTYNREGFFFSVTTSVACLPLVQQVRGSIPGGVVNFHLKIINLGARRGWRCTLPNH